MAECAKLFLAFGKPIPDTQVNEEIHIKNKIHNFLMVQQQKYEYRETKQ